MARDTLLELETPSGARTAPGALPILNVRLSGHRRGGVPILGPISFDLCPGETLALVGPSGIGKSSMLRLIAGLDAAENGHVTAPERIGMVFQEPLLLPWRNARANLTLTTGITAPEADALLREVGLASCAELYTGQMSLGQQRRLSLARAFASAPELLLLDEPFVSLDAALAREMMDLFARLRAASGVATILVTHAEEEVEHLADRVLTLGGTPARIVLERTLRKA